MIDTGRPCKKCGDTRRNNSRQCITCRNAYLCKQRKTPGTYAYSWSHGIGRPGEAARAAKNRLRHTLGTYSYNQSHGFGEAGKKARLTKRRYAKTVGSKAAQRRYAQSVKGRYSHLKRDLRRLHGAFAAEMILINRGLREPRKGSPKAEANLRVRVSTTHRDGARLMEEHNSRTTVRRASRKRKSRQRAVQKAR